MQNKISVLIPTYNCDAYVHEAINSVLNQTYKNFEIIVVDDGSTDNTKDVLRPYEEKKLITYIYQNNSVPAVARNTGILNSSGDYIAFLDADDLWMPEKLEKMIKKINDKKKFGMVITSVNFVDLYGNILRTTNYDQMTEDEIKEILMERCIVVMSSVLIQREVFEHIGLFDENLTYAEDWDFFYRLAREYRIGIINEPLTVYRVRESSLMRDRAKREKLFNDTFAVVEKIYAYPENSKCKHKKKFFYANFYRQYGTYDLYSGNLIDSRKYLFKSLTFDLFNLTTYMLLIKSFLRNTIIYTLYNNFRLNKEKIFS